MQGYTLKDTKDNLIRIIDFIEGDTLFNYIQTVDKNHEQYYYEDLPDILHKLNDCLQGILLLHNNYTCHGDIRNDHIIIDAHTKKYRWIDFDLNQNIPDFDLWSLGNIINFVVGKGINSFSGIMKSKHFSNTIKRSLTHEDASAFFEYRIMNLKKLYPYISEQLNDILLHFTLHPKVYYTKTCNLIRDYKAALKDFK